jgi:fructose-1,6-bisphosphatase/inositol monophosphatase family enzyme
MVTIDQLVEIARTIGEIHIEFFRKLDREKKEVKGHENPDICDVDRLADHIAWQRLGQMGVNIYSEESGILDKGSEETVFTDGLDGTSFYLMGKRYSCVSLGLERKKELVAGVIYNPLTGQLYTGEKGSGSFLEENGERRKLNTREVTTVDDVALAIPSLKALMVEDYNVQRFRDMVQNTWRFDCEGSIALNLCETADGILDVVLTPVLGGPWDFAAGVVILREAGGYVGGWYDTSFNIRNPTPFLAAANRKLYSRFKQQFFGGG